MGVRVDGIREFIREARQGKGEGPQWRYTLSGKRIPASTPRRTLEVARGARKADVPTPANLRARAFAGPEPTYTVTQHPVTHSPGDGRSRRARRPGLVRAAKVERRARRGGGEG